MLTDLCRKLRGPTTLSADMDKMYVPGSLYLCVTDTNLGNVDKNPFLTSERNKKQAILIGLQRFSIVSLKYFSFVLVLFCQSYNAL